MASPAGRWADWIIDRHFRFRFDTAGSAPGWAEDAEQMSGYLRRMPVSDDRGVRLPKVDTVWENLPEPHPHRYRAATDGPRTVIYRRLVPSPAATICRASPVYTP
jgi:hypothetical protein